MELFVWEDVLCDWTPGVMFALAESADHARELLLRGCSYIPEDDLLKEPKVYTEPFALSVWGGG